MNRVEWWILITAVVVSIWLASSLTTPGFRWLAVCGVMVASVVTARILAVRRVRQWPVLSDTAFLAEYAKSYRGQAERVVQARRHLAEVFGIEADRIRPEHTLRYLSESGGWLAGSHDVALNDLIEELEERTGGKWTGSSPDTSVGEYIQHLTHNGSGQSG